jgi:hypothetical protein
MKTLTLLATIASALCIVSSLIQRDWTEAMAWSIVTMHSSKDFVNLLK